MPMPDSAAHWNGHADHIAPRPRGGARSPSCCSRTSAGAAARAARVDRRDRRGCRRSAAWRIQRPRHRPISILDGMRARLGARRCDSPRPGRTIREFDVVPAEQLSSGAGRAGSRACAASTSTTPHSTGAPRLTRIDARVDFRWTLNSPAAGFRSTGTRRAGPAASPRRRGRARARRRRQRRLPALSSTAGSSSTTGRSNRIGTRPRRRCAWRRASSHAIRLEYFESTGNARLKLVWDAGIADDWRARIDRRGRARAQSSDVAVVVAGVEEGEFRDRAKLGLPGTRRN